MEDAMENRTKPSPSPRPLPRGEGEHANASSRLRECRLRSHAPKLGATAARPSPTRPNALAHSALPDEPSGSPSPRGRGRGEGEGISLSITAFFSAVGSGLKSKWSLRDHRWNEMRCVRKMTFTPPRQFLTAFSRPRYPTLPL